MPVLEEFDMYEASDSDQEDHEPDSEMNDDGDVENTDPIFE